MNIIRLLFVLIHLLSILIIIYLIINFCFTVFFADIQSWWQKKQEILLYISW